MTNNKIILTQEQAKAIEEYKANKYTLEQFAKHAENWVYSYEPLKTLSIDEMGRLLYEPNSYEVKQKYEVGQWVARADGARFNNGYIASEIDKVDQKLRLNGRHGAYTYDFLRHATPEEIKAEKERRLWSNIGRKVGEFKIGDIGLYGDNDVTKVNSYIDTKGISIMYKDGSLKGFYPIGEFISFEDGEES